MEIKKSLEAKLETQHTKTCRTQQKQFIRGEFIAINALLKGKNYFK